MALTFANDKQVRLARSVAWERGLTITSMPDTSAGLARLIQRMIAEVPALPITEEQEEQYQTLVAECVGKVENFQVERFATLPETRADANKAIYAMRGLLRRADANHVAATDLSAFVTSATEVEAEADSEGIAF